MACRRTLPMTLRFLLASVLVERAALLVIRPSGPGSRASRTLAEPRRFRRRSSGCAPLRSSLLEGRAPTRRELSEPLVVGKPDGNELGSSNLVFEGDYVVHYERGMCQFVGRVSGEHDGDGSKGAPILLRFSERTVALDAGEALYLTRLRGAEDDGGRATEEMGDLGGLRAAGGGVATEKYKTSAHGVGGDSSPRLSKWNQPEKWRILRQRAFEVSAEHAREIVTMAAARSKREREPCAPLTEEDVLTLDGGLGWPLTDGQLGCVADLEEDMCRRVSPMDRLVFGDVGYGKTEIAIRATLMACRSGRQVAILAPTTALAAQHYEVMRRRLGGFNLTVELLLSASKVLPSHQRRRRQLIEDGDAFAPIVSASAEIRRIRASVASGACDVCVGTHALLSPKQTWRRLGLAVIDEEQRFGVAQKERLKKACVEVDVLTLSATPIPRTLSGALAGLRDVSELPEPPPGRAQTLSVVAADTTSQGQDDKRLASLLKKELDRGGQAFYIVPRIADIPSAKRRIEKALCALGHPPMLALQKRRDEAALLKQSSGSVPVVEEEDSDDEDPDLDGDTSAPTTTSTPEESSVGPVVVAHGRLRDAPAAILDFAGGDNLTRPVLLATTLVENGLDLPRVNTIVIQDAHKFGLASLHQLRGRVGRSDREAIAVFLHPRSGVPDAARARLRAVADSSRSTGAELAKRDLEIRGAGALLGTKQSGKLSKHIGDELYTRMLRLELERLRAVQVLPSSGADASGLPAASVLKDFPTVGQAQTTEEVAAAAAELQPLTVESKTALKLRYLELYATRLGFERISLHDVDEEGTSKSAYIEAPRLDPETWRLLRREVPTALRANLRFDEPNGRVEVVRLGALSPVKQLDFLLSVFNQMASFLDRVNHVTLDVEEVESDPVEVNIKAAAEVEDSRTTTTPDDDDSFAAVTEDAEELQI